MLIVSHLPTGSGLVVKGQCCNVELSGAGLRIQSSQPFARPLEVLVSGALSLPHYISFIP